MAVRVESTTNTEQKVRKPEKRVSKLQVEDRTCKTCPRKSHSEGNKCPGLAQSCFACGQEYHFKGAQICKGSAPKVNRKPGDAKKGKTVNKIASSDSEIAGLPIRSILIDFGL